MKNGKVIIFSAPSGTGKTTIIRELLKNELPLAFSISACTRSPREGETNGKDYYFLSEPEFRNKINEGAFIEWEEVYEGNLYGTFCSEPERIWKSEKHVLFDVDVKGGLKLKEVFGEKALSIFIKPPSLEVLRERLESRSTDSPEVIQKRLDKAAFELSFSEKFDTVLVNDRLDEAVSKAYDILKKFLNL